jgi:hypothetical protein
VGCTRVQAIHHQGRWVALLVWGPAALKKLTDIEGIDGKSNEKTLRRTRG